MIPKSLLSPRTYFLLDGSDEPTNERNEGYFSKAMLKRLLMNAMYGTRQQVYIGFAEKTRHGVTRDDLVKSKAGSLITKKEQAKAKRQYRNSLWKWTVALQLARRELGISGFGAVVKGGPLHTKAKEIMTMKLEEVKDLISKFDMWDDSSSDEEMGVLSDVSDEDAEALVRDAIAFVEMCDENDRMVRGMEDPSDEPGGPSA